MIRVVLDEKRIETELQVEQYWEWREEFIAINPAGTVPVLIDDDGTVVVDAEPIAEYADEAFGRPLMIPGNAAQKAEVRRLSAWFSRKFYQEVTVNLFGEKLMKRLTRQGGPDSGAMRAGRINLVSHLAYIEFLSERRRWLAGADISLADIAAASQISCIDYTSDVPWDDFPDAKHWYARIKSRPSFRSLLAERFPGADAPSHYADLDF